MTSLEEKIVSKLEESVKSYYKFFSRNYNSSEETWIESDNLVLRYVIDLQGGMNLVLGDKNDDYTFIVVEHERRPHYAPLEHEGRCEHSFNKVTTKGNSFNSSWIGEIDDLIKKLD
jgi:hypothetical protein